MQATGSYVGVVQFACKMTLCRSSGLDEKTRGIIRSSVMLNTISECAEVLSQKISPCCREVYIYGYPFSLMDLTWTAYVTWYAGHC